MGIIEETHWYQNFDWSMIWTCVGAVLCLMLFFKAYKGQEVIQGQLAETIRGNFWWKVSYHLVSGLILLAIIGEIGVPLFDFLIQKAITMLGFQTKFRIDSSEEIIHTLAFISGLLGGWIVAKIIRFGQKKLM